MAAPVSRQASGAEMALFCPFRALGYITAPVPFAVQRRGRETFVTVSVGKAWQCYNCAKLSLVFVGQQACGSYLFFALALLSTAWYKK